MKNMIKTLLSKAPYISELHRQVSEQGAFPAGHYHSPIPSSEDIVAAFQIRQQPRPLTDVNLNGVEQRKLIEELAAFYEDLPFGEEPVGRCRYYFDQNWFCHTDAIMLYSLIRHFCFRRIIEVGSGFSSAVMLDTLEQFGPNDFELTCIEPYSGRLRALIDPSAVPQMRLIENRIQDVDRRVFETLRSGDLLFIDSSHVVKFQSDLHFLLFEVLPMLPVGVHVHFHDVFYPFEYPEEWLKAGRYWNECYFLRAFLAGNSDWQIVLFNHYVNLEFAAFIECRMPLCRKNFGGSLYLRKIR